MRIKTLFTVLSLLPAVALASVIGQRDAHAIDVKAHPKLAAIVDDLVTNEGFERDALVQIFDQAVIKDSVVAAMRRPAERLTWAKYKPLFVRPESIAAGVEFIGQYEDAFERAEKEFGVPREFIAAIIGVETRYGKVTGKHRIIDSLSSLVVGYPRRSDFFANELHEFMLLARHEAFDATTLKGSYAGAMGIPQFIASSYRNYAVDFDDDGVRDLLTNPIDAIGSIGNYLKKSGWMAGEAVVGEVDLNPDIDPETIVTKGRRPEFSVAELEQAGVELVTPAATVGKVALVGLDAASGRLYRLAYPNFFAIMRYNPSQLYAMAVYELGIGISGASPKSGD